MLFSDNGFFRVAADLAEYIEQKRLGHVHGAPDHPKTRGEIPLLTEPRNALPSAHEAAITAFVDHYNNHRHHKSLAKLTPADVYHNRGAHILKMREGIKKQTVLNRRLQLQAAA